MKSDYYHYCDMCEIDSGKMVLVWRENDFALCLDCIKKLFLEYVAPELKSEEKITVKRRMVSETTRNEIFKRDNYKCVECGSIENICLDHIIPFSIGGKTEASNLQTLCKSCNIKKGVK